MLPANLRPATPGHDEVVGQLLAPFLLHEPGEDGGGPLVIRERFAELAHVAQGGAAVAQAEREVDGQVLVTLLLDRRVKMATAWP